MPAESSTFKGGLAALAKRFTAGPMVLSEGPTYYNIPDSYTFVCQVSHAVSGASAVTTIIPDNQVPKGWRCYVTRADIYVNGANAASGGTGINIQDSAGNVVAAVAVAELTANTGYTLPANDGASGVTDNCIINKAAPGATTDVGLQVFNNGAVTLGASSPITVYVEGYFAP